MSCQCSAIHHSLNCYNHFLCLIWNYVVNSPWKDLSVKITLVQRLAFWGAELNGVFWSWHNIKTNHQSLENRSRKHFETMQFVLPLWNKVKIYVKNDADICLTLKISSDGDSTASQDKYSQVLWCTLNIIFTVYICWYFSLYSLL